MSKKPLEQTLHYKVMLELDTIELNGHLIKNDIVAKLWPYVDFYTVRTFDVALCKARKMMDKTFEGKGGIITRTA